MKPALALPYNDPDGSIFPHMQAILPDLKDHFERVYLSPPSSTFEWLQQKELIVADSFFTIFSVEEDMSVGKRFADLFQRTAKIAPPEQPIHLASPDRLCFALEGKYRESFLADIDSLTIDDLPLIFQRSELAWETHPRNYRQIEGIVTTVGMNLFGQELDYAWCHLVVQAGQLGRIMSLVKHPKISMVAEMVYYMQDDIKTRAVDWLAWEDPFIFNRDAAELKQEREKSFDETQKRLDYVLPMIDMLTKFSKNGK